MATRSKPYAGIAAGCVAFGVTKSTAALAAIFTAIARAAAIESARRSVIGSTHQVN